MLKKELELIIELIEAFISLHNAITEERRFDIRKDIKEIKEELLKL